VGVLGRFSVVYILVSGSGIPFVRCDCMITSNACNHPSHPHSYYTREIQ